MKTLVVYYSMSGNAKFAAELIARKMDADIMALEPIKEYPRSTIGKYIFCGKAATFGERPRLKPYLYNPADYDRVVIGMPIWNSRPASPINTFLENNDMRNKVTAAFICSAGGDAEKCIVKLNEKLGRMDGTLSLINAKKNEELTQEKVSEFVEQMCASPTFAAKNTDSTAFVPRA
ncbi:flavodoxin [Kineothrix alysoides]|uniref:Flavodoxin n=1 Tax=Kineothrix alysoides TaxID=1469948 RepID=A0A4R1QSJ3_9FIRM|nr:flavodoxin [Kineothrix alysoides]TCL56866.1 flavodoxin [Kineothrix alysoides]